MTTTTNITATITAGAAAAAPAPAERAYFLQLCSSPGMFVSFELEFPFQGRHLRAEFTQLCLGYFLFLSDLVLYALLLPPLPFCLQPSLYNVAPCIKGYQKTTVTPLLNYVPCSIFARPDITARQPVSRVVEKIVKLS